MSRERPPERRADAFAKLTLALRVLGARADGFHELDGVAVSVTAPADALTVRAAAAPGVRIAVTGPAAAGVPAEAGNLAVRAVEALLGAAGPARGGPGTGIDLLLSKRIPAGGGLGGGSADAAAALHATRDLLGLDVDDDVLQAIAATLGSDVPFCVTGGAARLQGRGEQLEPHPLPALAVVTAVPPYGCATPAVYRAWDELGGPAGREVAPPPGVDGLPPLVNDLEPAAHAVEPRLGEFRRALEAATGRPALLAGSGSAHVLLFAHHAEAERAAASIRATVAGATVHVGGTSPVGVVLEP